MYNSFASRGLIVSSLVVCAFFWPGSARPGTPGPAGPGGQWNLIFHDEFDGNKLDTSKWNTKFWYKDTDGDAFLSANNVTVGGGDANLTVTAHGAGSGSNYRPYTGAMINTYGKFHFSYGVFELRAKVPGGAGGMDTGAYLANDSGPGKDIWPPELDNMEIRSSNPYLPVMSYHYVQGGTNENSSYWYKGGNFSDAYHTYTMDWEPGYIRWYIDGIERASFTNASKITKLPMDIIISPIVCTASSGWCTHPTKNSMFPQHLMIDYVRVWQR